MRTVIPTEAFCRKGTNLQRYNPKGLSMKGKLDARSLKTQPYDKLVNYHGPWNIDVLLLTRSFFCFQDPAKLKRKLCLRKAKMMDASCMVKVDTTTALTYHIIRLIRLTRLFGVLNYPSASICSTMLQQFREFCPEHIQKREGSFGILS